MVTYWTPGPSSMKLPSDPALSPSVIISGSPMTGFFSLLVTFLPAATFTTPAGARNGSRGLPSGRSRLGTFRFCGVPSNIGFGSSMGRGASFSAAPPATDWAYTPAPDRQPTRPNTTQDSVTPLTLMSSY